MYTVHATFWSHFSFIVCRSKQIQKNVAEFCFLLSTVLHAYFNLVVYSLYREIKESSSSGLETRKSGV